MDAPLRSLSGCLLAAAVVFCRPAVAAEDCASAVAAAEQAEEIPGGLLAAIALVEAGRSDSPGGPRRAWPWTLNTGGVARYLASRREAVQMAAEWLERHPRILDVGCLQINLGYHPAAFRSLDEAFDPAANAAYAARFLRGLRDETGSWSKAVAAYHSRRPVEGQRYLTQVLAVWRPPAGRPPTVQLAAFTTVAPLPAAPREAVARLSLSDEVAPEIAPRLWLTTGNGPATRRRRGRAAIAVARGSKAASAGAPIPLTPAAKHPPLLIRVPAAGPPPPRSLTVIEGQAALDRLDALPSSDRLPALLALRRRAVPFAALSASLGSTYAELGDTAKALLFMAQAAELAPDQPRYRLNQAVLADHLGWHRQAIGAYEQFLAAYWRDPEEPPLPLAAIHQRLAYLRARARGPD